MGTRWDHANSPDIVRWGFYRAMSVSSLILMWDLAAVAQTMPRWQGILEPPRHGGIYVVAHRGAHEGIPENTLAAYRNAIELGCDFVEVDLRETKDGAMVSIHNGTVDQYTKGVTGSVKDFTLAELKAMDIGSRVGPEWANERIPTFEEILDLCAGKIGIYIDLKAASVDKVVAALKAHDMARHAVWYANVIQLRRMKEACPECIAMPDPGPEKFLSKLLETLHPTVVASSWDCISPAFAAACHGAGALLVVDEGTPEQWEEGLSWGIDGIQTDYPSKLIAFLDDRAKKGGKP